MVKRRVWLCVRARAPFEKPRRGVPLGRGALSRVATRLQATLGDVLRGTIIVYSRPLRKLAPGERYSFDATVLSVCLIV